jgi:hypothetical protein
MTTKFDYNRFLKYYTNPRNVVQEPNTRPEVQFYRKNSGVMETSQVGDTSIMVNNKKYFIKADLASKDIMFTLPTSIPGYDGLWDFHYHFGIDKMKVVNKLSPYLKTRHDLIYFHKTIQEPQNSRKYHENCYFFHQEPIDDITLFPDIKCLQTSDSTMSRFFPPGSEDINVITEIIRRPFYGIRYGGKKSRGLRKMGLKKKRRTRKLLRH